MRTNRLLRVLIAVLALTSMLAASFSLTSAQDAGNSITVSIMGTDDIPTLDPSLAEDVSGIQALDGMYTGLTTLNEVTIEVEPGIASGWEVSEDGMTYTFTLLPDIAWVIYNPETGEVEQVMDEAGNPRFVTAQDVVYGWQRSLNPETLGYYGNVLAPWVVGGAEMVALELGEDGTVDPAALEEARANLGITAVDDLTVQIQTPAARAFLPNIYGMWMARPLPQWAIEEHGDLWTEPGNFPSYGPFALKDWQHDVSVTFIKNPFWVGTETVPAASLDEWTNLFLEQSAALAEYEAGNLDYINPVSITDIPRVRVDYPEEFGVGPNPCTYYYGFNTEKAPMDNVHMRRALSLAIDRDAIVTSVTQGGQIPAAFFTRPDVAAGPNQNDYSEVAMLVNNDDEARNAAAQAELQAYLDETGTALEDLPPITLVHNTSEAHAAIAEAIQQMWADALGINVEISSQEWATFLDLRANDAPQVYRSAWCYDYPDANNWTYDVFRSDSGAATDGGNEPNWVNEEFDQLVTEAASLDDTEARREMYGRAEVLLTWEDAVIAPIYFYTTTYMLSPDVEAQIANTGLERFEKWSLR